MKDFQQKRTIIYWSSQYVERRWQGKGISKEETIAII